MHLREPANLSTTATLNGTRVARARAEDPVEFHGAQLGNGDD